ncbi:hypothetical protein ACHAXN_012658 [Cyclotella atomus]
MIATAIAVVISLLSCVQTQAVECTTTYPICGEGSTLCPHNMCAKPNGFCNRQGDGCVDIRFNRDGCLSPENTCGGGYCGTPPDFSDCACDNGTCIAVGPQNTFAPTFAPTSASPSASPTKEPSKSPSESPSFKEPTVKPTPEASFPIQERNLPTSDISASPSASSRPTTSSVSSLIASSEAPSLSTQPTASNKPSLSANPTTSDGSTMTKSCFSAVFTMLVFLWN